MKDLRDITTRCNAQSYTRCYFYKKVAEDIFRTTGDIEWVIDDIKKLLLGMK